ncbi:hypothetical protein [Deminuibacter soli]|nr:hypothetical protein [Deminuibacter soli]
MGFIAFMGFLLAQPLVISLYASKLLPAVEQYKQQLLLSHTAKIDAMEQGEIDKLIARKAYCMQQKNTYGTTVYNIELAAIDSGIQRIQQRMEAFSNAAQQTIGRNSFFLFRVQKVHHRNPGAWLLTLAIVLLFLLPGYLVYTLSSKHEYYQLKKQHEKALILDAYKFFTDRYCTLFDEPVSIFTRYEDPPFNTRRKQPPAAAHTADFLQKYLEQP